MIRLLVIVPTEGWSAHLPAFPVRVPGVESREVRPEAWSDIVLALNAFSPDIVMIGGTVLGSDGIIVAGDIIRTKAGRPTSVIILAETHRDRDVVAAAHAGVRGYLVGGPGVAGWRAVFDAVSSGGGWLSPEAAGHLLDAFRIPRPQWRDRIDRIALTERELSVIRLIAGGCSNLEAARELGLSQSTIKTHVSRMLAKLNLHSRTQLAAFARDAGIV